jgi:hypothetical protein
MKLTCRKVAITALGLLVMGSQALWAGSATCPTGSTADTVTLTTTTTGYTDNPICFSSGTGNPVDAERILNNATYSTAGFEGLFLADKEQAGGSTDPYDGALTISGDSDLTDPDSAFDDSSSSGTWSIDLGIISADLDLSKLILTFKRGDNSDPSFVSFLLPDATGLSGTVGGAWSLACTGESNCSTTNLSNVGLYAVPLPAAAWLFLSAIAGVVGIGYRRRQSA